MGYAIIHNYFIGKEDHIHHIYNANIISNVENGIIIRIGETSLCREITVTENLEHTLWVNSIYLIASNIEVNENYSCYLHIEEHSEKDKYGGETTIMKYKGYAEENEIIMLSAFIGETVCRDCLERLIENISRVREGE